MVPSPQLSSHVSLLHLRLHPSSVQLRLSARRSSHVLQPTVRSPQQPRSQTNCPISNPDLSASSSSFIAEPNHMSCSFYLLRPSLIKGLEPCKVPELGAKEANSERIC